MGTLISTDIPIVQDLTDHGDVPVVHPNPAVFSILGAGRRWVQDSAQRFQRAVGTALSVEG